MANWITPKTDWTSEDYWNVEDYNRIVGNMYFLQYFAKNLFEQFELEHMDEEKAYYEFWYAEMMNTIEDNLVIINEKTYNFDIGDKSTYAPDTPIQTPEELNRIESALLEIYNTIYGQTVIRQHLAIPHLGGAKNFGRRAHYAKQEIEAYRFNWTLGLTKGGFKL